MDKCECTILDLRSLLERSNINKLQHERPSCDYSWSSRQEIPSNQALQHRALSTALLWHIMKAIQHCSSSNDTVSFYQWALLITSNTDLNQRLSNFSNCSEVQAGLQKMVTFEIKLFIVFFFLADLWSNHDYLRQLYDLCTHSEKDLLQPVDGGN